MTLHRTVLVTLQPAKFAVAFKVLGFVKTCNRTGLVKVSIKWELRMYPAVFGSGSCSNLAPMQNSDVEKRVESVSRNRKRLYLSGLGLSTCTGVDIISIPDIPRKR